jgi:chaperonin GroEL
VACLPLLQECIVPTTELVFSEEAHHRIQRGIDVLADAVKVTLGPRGRTVIVEGEFGAPRIVNSGVVVARSIELGDPFENLGAQLLREAAARTSEMAGDGTTTATVLAHAMIREGLKYVAAGMNPMELKRGIDRGVAIVTDALGRLAVPCAEDRQIAHVAAISANNDAAIGDLVARAIGKVGREGAISIEDGSGIASELEVVEGLKFDRGFLSAYFVSDQERQQAVLENALVLVCDGRIATAASLVPVLEAAAKAGAPLLVIAEDLDNDVLATLVVNNLRGVIRTCAIKAPGFGEQRKTMLADIALVTGASLVSSELGVALDKVSLEQLGKVRRASVDKDSTTLVGGAGDAGAIAERIAALKKERGAADGEYQRKQLDDHIARLAGGVGVIKVGASTEVELKERKLRVEDALHAARAAIEEGIVPGGGVALLRARETLSGMDLPTLEQRSGLGVVARALEEPLRRIVENAADEPSIVLEQVQGATPASFGYNAATRAFGDLFEMGVIDPTKVTRLALQNAGSIAGLVLTTDCMIARVPSRAATPGGGPADMM